MTGEIYATDTNADLIDTAQLKAEAIYERLTVLQRRYGELSESSGDDYDPERVATVLATVETLMGEIGDLVP